MPATPPIEAMRLTQGFRIFQMLVAACELRIPDLLADGPRSVGDLARVTETHEDALRRFLRGLVVWGVLEQLPDDQYASTTLADSFRSDRPGLRSRTLMFSDDAYAVWAKLLYSLRTGEPAYEQVLGKPMWEVMAENPQMSARFNAAMVETSKRIGAGFVESYDLASVAVAVDVGGGNGALLAALLKARPAMRGVLFDLASGLRGARERLEDEGIADRVTIVEGDFFKAVPEAGDLYLLKNILHDWDDGRATEILTACRRCMPHSARLVVVERSLPERIDTSPASFDPVMTDLMMLVTYGGRERTVAQYGELFAGAGLRATSSGPIGVDFGFFEAVPA